MLICLPVYIYIYIYSFARESCCYLGSLACCSVYTLHLYACQVVITDPSWHRRIMRISLPDQCVAHSYPFLATCGKDWCHLYFAPARALSSTSFVLALVVSCGLHLHLHILHILHILHLFVCIKSSFTMPPSQRQMQFGSPRSPGVVLCLMGLRLTGPQSRHLDVATRRGRPNWFFMLLVAVRERITWIFVSW